jgi:hypothetical protein
MNKKFLITVIIPTLEMEFDAYVPNNKKIGTIKKNIIKSIVELSNNNFIGDEQTCLFINKDSGDSYDNNMYVKDSGIKNGSKIIII